ncbi:MAG: 23S rRNA (uracil(1939)-C(5))-methyltransferase RlmD [Lachnospiraceae bacterium]|nr:23S rRNA (uracil(1939)-C(5))-methyltransferase RlmD [Lachnospiraceae bacterium]
MKMSQKSEKVDISCPVYKKCGGCQLLHMEYKKQLDFKREQITTLLKPYGKLEGIIGMETPEHYRHKVHAVFGRDNRGRTICGVYKEGTHIIVPVEKCLLENEKADEIIQTIKGLLKSFKIKTYDEDTGYGLLRHVLVRVGCSTGQIMVVLVLGSPILPSKNNFVKALRKVHPEITTVVINVNDKKTSMVLGDKEQVIYGPGYIEDRLCGMTFKISPKSFYQVNPRQTEVLYQKAIAFAELSGKEVVLDAYCGTGTIGMIAAPHAGRVIGVELNKDAVRDAIAGAKRNQISNIRFYQADAGDFMVKMADSGEKVDVVLMDPPRTGSSEKFLKALVQLGPRKIVYVSCNPETLARDLQYLCRKGYEMKKGVGVDMFPFTKHVETVVAIQRKDACGADNL